MLTNEEWLEEQEEAIAEEELAVLRERWLAKCRRQRVVTQGQLEEIVKEREYLEDWRERTLELAREQIIGDLEDELAWDEAKLRAALEGGAVVEAGELRVEDALPGENALPEDRQMKLGF